MMTTYLENDQKACENALMICQQHYEIIDIELFLKDTYIIASMFMCLLIQGKS